LTSDPSEEIKFICRQIIAGRLDKQIKEDLEENWGKRDIRTIRLIRRVFEAGHEVVIDHLRTTGRMAEGQLSEDIRRTIDIVDHMVQGLRPVYQDKKSGEIKYETWLEI
jgi:hypothetical protein